MLTTIKKPKAFLSYTGITRQQFDVILKNVRKNHRITGISKGKRQRDIGAGHPFDLDVKDRLVNAASVFSNVFDL